MVFVAGQMSDDADGNLVHSGDLAAQARQVFTNLGRALTADVLLGVETLAAPGYLIEVDATAVI